MQSRLKGSVAFVLAMLAGCSSHQVSNPSQEQGGRFYTWVDAQGRLHTDPLPQKALVVAPVPVAEEQKAQVPASSGKAGSIDVDHGVGPVAGSAPQPVQNVAAPVEAQPATAGDTAQVFAADDTFVDSDELERKHFNLQGKKKFAYVPDTAGVPHVMYYETGEGQDTLLPRAQPASTDGFWADGIDTQALLGAGCCQTLLKPAPDELRYDRSFHPSLASADCVSAAKCTAASVYKLPAYPKDHVLRLQSYLSSTSCKRCLSWPRVVVLDRDGRVLRGYQAELAAYKAETWHSYAWFYYDIKIDHARDAYLMLVAPENDSMTYKNKRYQFIRKGELAFTVVK